MAGNKQKGNYPPKVWKDAARAGEHNLHEALEEFLVKTSNLHVLLVCDRKKNSEINISHAQLQKVIEMMYVHLKAMIFENMEINYGETNKMLVKAVKEQKLDRTSEEILQVYMTTAVSLFALVMLEKLEKASENGQSTSVDASLPDIKECDDILECAPARTYDVHSPPLGVAKPHQTTESMPLGVAKPHQMTASVPFCTAPQALTPLTADEIAQLENLTIQNNVTRCMYCEDLYFPDDPAKKEYHKFCAYRCRRS